MIGLLAAFIFIIVIEIIDIVHKRNEYIKNEKLHKELEEKIRVVLEEYKEICVKDSEKIFSKYNESVKNTEEYK